MWRNRRHWQHSGTNWEIGPTKNVRKRVRITTVLEASDAQQLERLATVREEPLSAVARSLLKAALALVVGPNMADQREETKEDD